MEDPNETTEDFQHEDFAEENTPQFNEPNEPPKIERRVSNSPKTAQQAYLAAALGDIIKIQETTDNALINAQKIRVEIAEAFSEAEKSISEMNTQVEDSIKKHGDKSAATLKLKLDEATNTLASNLDFMIKQIDGNQIRSLKIIEDFFAEKGNQLAPEAERTRLENVEIAKAEIDNAKLKAVKEIAILIDKINGDKLASKLITYAIVLTISSSLITTSLIYIINNATLAAQAPQTSQTQQSVKVKNH